MKLTVKRSLFIALILFVFLILAMLALSFLKIDRKVTTPGVFTYRRSVPIVVEQSGFVEKIPATENASVKNGDVLVVLRNSSLSAQIENAGQNVALLLLELAGLKRQMADGVSSLGAQARYVERELTLSQEKRQIYDRLLVTNRELYESGMGPKSEYDSAVIAHMAALSAVYALESRLSDLQWNASLLESNSQQQVQFKETQISMAQENLTFLKKKQSKLTVQAQADGFLLAQNLHGMLHTFVAEGSKIGDIVSLEELDFTGYARGTDIIRIKEGQEVTFNIELFRRRRVVAGTVSGVGVYPETADGLAGYPVEIDVGDRKIFDRGQIYFLQAGVPGEAVIIIEKQISLFRLLWERLVKVVDTL